MPRPVSGWGEVTVRRAFPNRSIPMLTAVVLAACGGGTDPVERFDLNGDWKATVYPKGGGVGTAGAIGSLSFTITETDGVITGTGRVDDLHTVQLDVVVSGTYDPPVVRLTLDHPSAVLHVVATANALNQMPGTLSGWVFDEAEVPLTR